MLWLSDYWFVLLGVHTPVESNFVCVKMHAKDRNHTALTGSLANRKLLKRLVNKQELRSLGFRGP